MDTPFLADARTLIALSLLPGVGRKTIRKVLGMADAAVPEVLEAALLSLRRRGPKLAAGCISRALADADGVLQRCVVEGVTILHQGDAGWPRGCDDLADPPLLLYILGSAEALVKPSCAIVGTRESSRYGEESARRIAARCAERSLLTVSGLAIGIDTSVHIGTVEAGGITIAVLPWGVDRIVPASNGRLAKSIIASGGTIVSELPPGTPGEPTPFSFIDRDRLQPALGTVGLILIESGDGGGSMHAVRYATSIGRRVAAVVHPHGGAGSAANRSLVESGVANPLASREDLARWLGEVRA
jgi:DNA processing protein